MFNHIVDLLNNVPFIYQEMNNLSIEEAITCIRNDSAGHDSGVVIYPCGSCNEKIIISDSRSEIQKCSKCKNVEYHLPYNGLMSLNPNLIEIWKNRIEIFRDENYDTINIVICNKCDKIVVVGDAISATYIGQTQTCSICKYSCCGLHFKLLTCIACCKSYCFKCLPPPKGYEIGGCYDPICNSCDHCNICSKSFLEEENPTIVTCESCDNVYCIECEPARYHMVVACRCCLTSHIKG